MDEIEKIYTLYKKDETLLPLIEETFKKANIAIEIRSYYDRAYDGLFIGQRGLADIYVLKKDKSKSLAILKDLIKD